MIINTKYLDLHDRVRGILRLNPTWGRGRVYHLLKLQGMPGGSYGRLRSILKQLKGGSK